MAKQERIRLIYSVFLSLFIVAIGITFIAVCADIYYSGKGTDVIYSREIVGEKLKLLSIPLVLLLAAVIAGAVFPLVAKKPALGKDAALKKLSARIPTGGNEKFAEAESAYNKVNKIRLAIWLGALFVVFASSVACLVYLCITANFKGVNGEEIYPEILKLVSIFLPLTLVSIAVCAAVSIYNGVLVEKQLKAAKTMIANGNGELRQPSDFAKKAEAAAVIASSKTTLLVIRVALLIFAITFIILGIFNGGADDVLGKAVNICTECIGLG